MSDRRSRADRSFSASVYGRPVSFATSSSQTLVGSTNAVPDGAPPSGRQKQALYNELLRDSSYSEQFNEACLEPTHAIWAFYLDVCFELLGNLPVGFQPFNTVVNLYEHLATSLCFFGPLRESALLPPSLQLAFDQHKLGQLRMRLAWLQK